ncbi:MAG: lytic murein transglycosylase, partial [Halofilum sp. (in: g-proteobacteria)]
EGSWAGALGHVQFMPSVFAEYAVDYDDDGRRDLWNSVPDAMASAANFLRGIGWEPGWRWGREVTLPAEFPYELSGYDGGPCVSGRSSVSARPTIARSPRRTSKRH